MNSCVQCQDKYVSSAILGQDGRIILIMSDGSTVTLPDINGNDYGPKPIKTVSLRIEGPLTIEQDYLLAGVGEADTEAKVIAVSVLVDSTTDLAWVSFGDSAGTYPVATQLPIRDTESKTTGDPVWNQTTNSFDEINFSVNLGDGDVAEILMRYI